jgi:hypothetical protein
VLLHHGQCLVPALDQLRQLRAPRTVRRQPAGDEARHGHVGLMAVLLEEHPLQHQGALPRIGGVVRRALGEVAQHGVRLGQPPPVLELQQRHASVRVHRQELGVRVAPFELSVSTQRKGMPSSVINSRGLKQLPDGVNP